MQGACELASLLSADGVAYCYGSTGKAVKPIAQAVSEDRCYFTPIRRDLHVWESDREDSAVLDWLEFEQHLLDHPPLVELSRGTGNRCHVYFLPGSKCEEDYLQRKAEEFDVVPKGPMVRPPETLYKDGSCRSAVVGDVPAWIWELEQNCSPESNDSPAFQEFSNHAEQNASPDSFGTLPLHDDVRELLDQVWDDRSLGIMRVNRLLWARGYDREMAYQVTDSHPQFHDKMHDRSISSRGREYHAKHVWPVMENSEPEFQAKRERCEYLWFLMRQIEADENLDSTYKSWLLSITFDALRHGDIEEVGIARRRLEKLVNGNDGDMCHSDRGIYTIFHRDGSTPYYTPLFSSDTIGAASQMSFVTDKMNRRWQEARGVIRTATKVFNEVVYQRPVAQTPPTSPLYGLPHPCEPTRTDGPKPLVGSSDGR